MSLQLGTLSDDALLVTGEPTFCTQCNASLSKLSNILRLDGTWLAGPEQAAGREPTATVTALLDAHKATAALDEDDSVWICEFCGCPNTVTLDEEEIPSQSTDSMDYVVAAEAGCMGSGAPSGDAEDASYVIYCVDISGSMCVTSEMEGAFELRGADERAARERELRAELGQDFGVQRMPNERRNITYVSRLQAVQAAIDQQIKQLAESFPDRRVGLITFNNELTVIGDGEQAPKTIAGDRLSDFDWLKTNAATCSFDGKVKDCADRLSKKIFELAEGGATALGPAVLTAVGIASAKPGSKVVVCTDGLANIGVGSLEETGGPLDAEGRTPSQLVYSRIADLAMEKGVVIDVLGIDGDGCDLETIGIMSERSGGDVELVDPLHLTENFANILSNPVIATNVEATLLLHRDMEFKNTSADDAARAVRALGAAVPDEHGAAPTSTPHLRQLQKTIGNVTSDSTVTFEYGFLPSAASRRRQQQDGASSALARDIGSIPEGLHESTASLSLDGDTLTRSAAAAPAAPDSAADTATAPDSAADTATVPDSAADTATAPDSAADTATAPDSAADTATAPDSAATAPADTRAMQVEALEELTKVAVPFQVQVNFTKLNGMKCIRIVSQTQKITFDRRQAEGHMNHRVLASHSAQQCSDWAQNGAYGEAEVNANAYVGLMRRNVVDQRAASSVQALEQHLTPMLMGLRDAQASEEALGPAMPAQERSARRRQMRSKTDGLSSMLRKNKKWSAK